MKKCRRFIVKTTLLFATIGLAAELFIVLLIGFGARAEDFFVIVGYSVLGLYTAALILGSIAAGAICEGNLSGFKRSLIGTGVAWGALLIQTLFGSFTGFLLFGRNHNEFGDYVFKPLFWVMFLGTIPAILIGLVYSIFLKKASSHK
jgi:hypothetical protein